MYKMGYQSWRTFLVYILAVCLCFFIYVVAWYLNSRRVIRTCTETLASERNLDVIVDLNKFPRKEETGIKVTSTKYILLWTPSQCMSFIHKGNGQEIFINESCKYINCYVTDNKDYLGDVTKFDVIAFLWPLLISIGVDELPQKRSPHQKYTFASIESSHNCPVIDQTFDAYFNWTWTYKLDSDARWGYIVIRNAEGNIIGPNKDMHWMKTEDMEPVSNELMTILKGKSRAAAWFVSHCVTMSERELFVQDLQRKAKTYGLDIDIYGKCGNYDCSNNEICNELVEKHYFFYLALENSFGEDYVTEKVLHALQHSAIPIVYGGANYSRFLPNGSYLNARELSTKQLVEKMNYLIHHFEEYSKYFKWRNHYYYHKRSATSETSDYCGICALLNDKKKMEEKSVYQDFRQWWNP